MNSDSKTRGATHPGWCAPARCLTDSHGRRYHRSDELTDLVLTETGGVFRSIDDQPFAADPNLRLAVTFGLAQAGRDDPQITMKVGTWQWNVSFAEADELGFLLTETMSHARQAGRGPKQRR